MSWNVHDHRGERAVMVEVIQRLAPDVLLLQEAWRLPGSRRVIGSLAAAAGLRHIVGGRPAAGTAVLVSTALAGRASGRSIRLAVRPPWDRPRGVAILDLDPGPAAAVGQPRGRSGAGWRLASAHLGLSAAQRAAHVRTLTALLSGHPRRLVLAADLNEAPDGPSWRGLAPLVTDRMTGSAPTYPAAAPRLRIDAVLVSDDLEVTDLGLPGVAADRLALASDHRPVLVEIRPAG